MLSGAKKFRIDVHILTFPVASIHVYLPVFVVVPSVFLALAPG